MDFFCLLVKTDTSLPQGNHSILITSVLPNLFYKADLILLKSYNRTELFEIETAKTCNFFSTKLKGAEKGIVSTISLISNGVKSTELCLPKPKGHSNTLQGLISIKLEMDSYS